MNRLWNDRRFSIWIADRCDASSLRATACERASCERSPSSPIASCTHTPKQVSSSMWCVKHQSFCETVFRPVLRGLVGSFCYIYEIFYFLKKKINFSPSILISGKRNAPRWRVGGAADSLYGREGHEWRGGVESCWKRISSIFFFFRKKNIKIIKFFMTF